MAALVPPTTLCEDDNGSGGGGEVIPAQLPVNDRQIDDVVEELIHQNDVTNLQPLLGLHGAFRNLPTNRGESGARLFARF